MTLPTSQKQNVKHLINEELSQKIDEEGLALSQAFINLVLDYKGYNKDAEWRNEHISDGSRDFGIDFWEISANHRDITLMQFKSFEGDSDYLDDTRTVTPDKISDLNRIIQRLTDLDFTTVNGNSKIKSFLQRYQSALSKVKDEEEAKDRRLHVRVIFCALAGALTDQATRQLEDLMKKDAITVDGVDVLITFTTYLIDNLIEEKWREENTEWRDKTGSKRDTATVRVSGNVIEEPKSLVFFAKAIDLVEMFEDYGYQIFEPNVRCEIEKSKVNEAIRNSVSSTRGRKEFKHLNNGLTVISEGFRKIGKPTIEKVNMTQPGVINGLQTLKSVHDAYHELHQNDRAHFKEHCEILVRLHTRNAVQDYRNLVKSTNNQNPMQQRNLRANDPEQITYERLFAESGWFFERKEGAWAAFKSDSQRWGTLEGKKTSDFRTGNIVRSVDNEQLGQCWLACIGFSNDAVQRRTDIFGDDELYDFVYQHTPGKHGSQYEFRLDVKEVLKHANPRSPDPSMLLFAYILREVARKFAPSAKKHRDSAIERLGLQNRTREKQNEELNKDSEYLKGVILRAVSYIFPEVVGYCLYKAFGAKFCDYGKVLLSNGTTKRLHKQADFNVLKAEFESGSWMIDKTDLLQTCWYLFDHLIDNLIASNWRDQWMMAPNRTRFNYGISTRQKLMKEIDEIDKFVQQSQLARQWAVGINESKGVYKYIKKVLEVK